ncbi:hypothetical protein CVV68_16915 [Arthrobacter livingstonensis]|uniref:HTH arsR-type domain-containing protein n=1 Tax=Arthrobacter livingstonensis TaxID=670078 RepID=A0A2V5L6A3_9MICC|nr:hypothetical protein CVV68_16915 [Arthrobacter livingstonensis]
MAQRRAAPVMSRILCTSSSARLLHLLAANGPQDVGAICKALKLKPGRVRHQLWGLLRLGFVIRTSSRANASPWRYAANRGQVDQGLLKLLVDFGAGPE